MFLLISFVAGIIFVAPMKLLIKNYPSLFWIITTIIIIILIGQNLWHRSRSKSQTTVPLDEQLSKLNELGINLKAGVCKDDLLKSYSEKEYESDSYFLLLCAMGYSIDEEPWDREVSDLVWHFDYECIDNEDSYLEIVHNIARLAGVNDRLNNVESHVDFKKDTAKLRYDIGSVSQVLTPSVDDDWADELTVKRIMEDCRLAASCDKNYWYLDNGQASVYLFITNETANKLNKIRHQLVRPVC